jgi:hypothetical protein
VNAPRRPARARRGNTLVETVLSTGIVVMVVGGVFQMLRDSGEIFGESVRSAHDRQEMDASLEQLAREVEQAAASTVVVDTSSADGDAIRFQKPLDLADPALPLGATAQVNGNTLTYDGATIHWLVATKQGHKATTQLLRRVIAADGQTVLNTEVVCDDLDLTDPAGNKSFTIAFRGPIATVTLRRLPRSDAGVPDSTGASRGRSQSITVRLRSR